MSFTAYINDQEKSDRYAAYCELVKKKKADGVTVARTQQRFRGVDTSNPLFNPLHLLHAQHPQSLNEIPSWVRRNLGDSEAIVLDDDDDNSNDNGNVRSACGIQVRGNMNQHINGRRVGHQRSALSVYNERTGQPFQFGHSPSVIVPTHDQKVHFKYCA